MTKARLAILGAGLIGREHARLVGACADAELAAIADPAPAAQGFAAELGVPYYSDYEQMLDTETLDGAIVAVPNAMHLPAGLACIARGLPCLIEKPITDTLAAARQLVHASQAAAVPVLVGHHRRHSPDIREARRLVQSGALGDLVAVNGMCLFDKPDSYFDAAWRRQPGGGPLLINLIHDIDALRFICGEINAVQAFTSNAARGFAVEDSSTVALRFDSGVLGSFVISDAAASPWSWEFTSGQALYFPHQPGAYMFFGGRKASLSVSDMTLWRHDRPNGDWRHPFVRERVVLDTSHAYMNQLAHFLDIIVRRVPPLVTAEDGMMSLAVTLAIKAAAQQGCTVTLPDFLADQAAATP